jgi:hypothetical protein
MLTDLYVITVFLKNCHAFIFRVKLLDAGDEGRKLESSTALL